MILRRYVRDDLAAFQALLGDADVMRYVGDRAPLSSAESSAMFERIFAIYDAEPAKFIWAVEIDGAHAGHAELKRRPGRSEYEIVYLLERRRWGSELGSRLFDLILNEARARRLPFAIATIADENQASLAIVRRRGFVADAKLSEELDAPAYRKDL